ncbi:replicative helicase loader/inhibitor [Halalkalibacter alkaliphilus]|uniref:Replicative helicase loader/inhibitor n=1 Tax=Halalkalibacter alkaliphilus TaxID=2917993 RepID=A0A9X2CUZ3_9BACI|nr:replicative helicase loader/inhibitor [Halalkalibacter alkaliphilus]MCL7748811.1 replicative helicase loader/inhibitor [Halalkalibacter alkaliphilus]
MTNEEAAEVLLTIHEVYPSYEITERKIKILVPALLKMDLAGVMKRLNEYIMTNPWPPTISDIASYSLQENEVLRKTQEYEKRASENPPTKEQIEEFHERFKQFGLTESEDE